MDNKIAFRKIEAGFYEMVVDGIARPVHVYKAGSKWCVRSASMNMRDRGVATEMDFVGETPTLASAKSLMVFAWLAIQTTRELAQHEALEEELERLSRTAREMKITYPIFADDTPIRRKVACVRALIETHGHHIQAAAEPASTEEQVAKVVDIWRTEGACPACAK